MVAKLTTEVTLGSLVRRIGKSEVDKLKQFFATYDCELKKIGRSRNWKVVGAYDDILVASVDLGYEVEDGASNLSSVLTSLRKALLQAEAHEPVVKHRIMNIGVVLQKEDMQHVKSLSAEHGVRYKRVSRTTHIDLIGNPDGMSTLCGGLLNIYPASSELMGVAEAIKTTLSKYGIKPSMAERAKTLIEIIKSDPSITAQQLCAMTNCAMKDAREAFDEWEFGGGDE
jgi:hypothetical protein